MDWLQSIGITLVIFLLAPWAGNYIIEPFCRYCSWVLLRDDKQEISR